MKRSSLYLLSSVLVLLALTFYVVKRPNERGMQRLRFAKLAFAKLDRIELSGAHQAALYKDGDEWRLQNGRRADAQMVERMLSALVEVQSTEWLTDDSSDFDDMGVLGDKATHVRLESKGREVLAFSLSAGGGEPGSEPRVMYREAVWQVEPGFAQAVAHGDDQWLDRRVWPLAETDAQALEVALRGEPAYTVRRSAEDAAGWTLDAPPGGLPSGFRFDASQASSLVNVLFGMQLQRFVDVDPGVEVTGLSPASAERWTAIGEGDANAARTSLWVGHGVKDKEGEVYARVDGRDALFVLIDSQVAGVRRKRNDLRALNMMASVNYDDVVEGGIERRGQKPMVFTRAQNVWSLKTGKGLASFVPDLVKVNQRLRKMTLARAIGIAGPKEGTLTPSAGRLWLRTKDGQEHVLTLGPKASPSEHGTPNHWARGTADSLIYRMSKPLFDELIGGPSTLEKASSTAKAAPAPTGEGLEGLPPEIRAKLQQQMAAQGQAG